MKNIDKFLYQPDVKKVVWTFRPFNAFWQTKLNLNLQFLQ